MSYLKDPAAIYRKSFAMVREATALERFPDDVGEVVIRLVHSCGIPDIAEMPAEDNQGCHFASCASCVLKVGCGSSGSIRQCLMLGDELPF